MAANGQFRLVMQSDGNLVEYNASGDPVWSAGTYGTGSANTLVMQSDGNLVMYTSGGKAVWSSSTFGTGASNTLVLQNDGNLVMYTAAGKAVWSTGTYWASTTGAVLYARQMLHVGQMLTFPNGTGAGSYSLVMQGDGNLVEYANGAHSIGGTTYTLSSQAVWDSGTYGTGSNNTAVLQSDGNFVIYTAAGKAVWDSGTYGTGGSNHLYLTGDGNIVMGTVAGTNVWQSGTGNAESTLFTGEVLQAGHSITSASGGYTLTMQTDGNLVLYTSSGKAVWDSAASYGSGSQDTLVMQPDGNLVIYTAAGKAVWNAGTYGTGATAMTVGSNGVVTVRTTSGRVVWSS